MRITATITLLALTVGCRGSATYQRQGAVVTDCSGVSFTEAGSTQIGMDSTTCHVDTLTGEIGTDYDYPGNSDQVVDAGVLPDGDDVVVVTSDKGVHIQRSDLFAGAVSDDFHIGPVEDAEISQDGVVVHTKNQDSCEIKMVGSEITSVTRVEGDFCDGETQLEADSSSRSVFLGSARGILHVIPGQSAERISDTGADRLAYDASLEMLYAGSVDGSEVSGLNTDGSLVWTVQLDGMLADLVELGDQGQVLVSVDSISGPHLLRLNGDSGAQLERIQTFNRVNGLSSSQSGLEFAAIRDGSVDFFGPGESNLGTANQVAWEFGL